MEEAVSSTPETILEEDELTQLYRTQPIFYENPEDNLPIVSSILSIRNRESW